MLSLAALVVASLPVSAAELFPSRSLAPDATWQATRGARAVSGAGLSAAMANPAALSGLQRTSIAFSHLVWAGDLSREWFAVGAPLGSRIHFGLDASLLHGASLQGYDAIGEETESFSVSEWHVSPQASADVGAGFSVGAGVRYFRLEDPNESVDGVGFSGGVRWSDGLRSVGASFNDYGSDRSTTNGTFTLPSRWRVGAEQTFGVASLAVSAVGQVDQTRLLAAAVYHPVPWVSLLGGVESVGENSEDAFGWSTGISADRSGIVASYAFSQSEALGAVHQFGIEIPLRPDSDLWGTSTRR